MATRFYSSVEYGAARGGDADTVYYNANIVNNSTSDAIGDAQDPQVVFSESRQTPILRDPSDYMMSVIQLSYTGALQNLPIFIPRIQVSSPTVTFTGTIAVIGGVFTLTVGQVSSGTIVSGQALVIPGIPGSAVIVIGSSPYTGQGGGGTYQLVSNTFLPIPLITNMEQVLPQNDPNLTVYSITVEDTVLGGSVRVFLKWIPPNKYASVPPAPVIQQNLSTDYYYAYTTDSFVQMFNVAYQLALGTLNVPSFTTYLLLGQYQLNADPVFSLPIPTGIKVFFNTALESVLTNFPGNYTNLDNGRSFQLLIPSGQANQVVTSQETGCTNSWSPVVSLCITSNLLPLNLEQCATPALVGASSKNTLGSVSPGTYLPIVADTVIDTTIRGALATRQSYIFEPAAEFRMISLTASTAPINQIDFNVWWRNRLDNNLYPLRLVPGSSVAIKAVFRRKQMGV